MPDVKIAFTTLTVEDFVYQSSNFRLYSVSDSEPIVVCSDFRPLYLY